MYLNKKGVNQMGKPLKKKKNPCSWQFCRIVAESRGLAGGMRGAPVLVQNGFSALMPLRLVKEVGSAGNSCLKGTLLTSVKKSWPEAEFASSSFVSNNSRNAFTLQLFVSAESNFRYT